MRPFWLLALATSVIAVASCLKPVKPLGYGYPEVPGASGADPGAGGDYAAGGGASDGGSAAAGGVPSAGAGGAGGS